jgi:hypothetical protein
MIKNELYGSLPDGTQITDDLLPVIHKLQAMQLYFHISNNDYNRMFEKRAGLRAAGLSEAEIEDACRSEPLDREAIMAGLAERGVAERKACDKYNRQFRKPKPRRRKPRQDPNICYLS